MGKVGPNHWSSNQVILSTNLVTHEDKTRNHSDPMRAQTCVILVKYPGELKIQDDQQQQVFIPRLELDEARQTVGVWLAPNGDWELECQYLHLVATDWKVWMATECLNPTDATFSLKNVVLQKLTYPLIMTTFTHQQCQHILAPVLNQGLSRAGIVHTYPRSLVYGPLQYGAGLDISQLYMEQIIAHIHSILWYGTCQDDPMGYLWLASGEAMQLEMGYGGKLLEAPLCLQDNITN